MNSRLREILDNRGIKQSYLCRKVGVSNTTMSALVRGERLPTLVVAYKIAVELGVHIEDIWYIDENNADTRR